MNFFGIECDQEGGYQVATSQVELIETLNFLKPKPCPFPLIKHGGEIDGAYLVPEDLDGIQACFSPGTANFKNFEDELLEEYEIASHMCDRSSDVEKFKTPLIEGKQTFKKRWLDIDTGGDSISLETWVNELAPGDRDLILQMDIEGAEYRNILNTPTKVLNRFRIIIIELHGLGRFNSPNVFDRVLKPFFNILERSHICIHAHPNNAGPLIPILHTEFRVPSLIELTLLRKDRFKGPADKYNSVCLPHPLDIPRNVKRKAPIFLDENWLDGPRSVASTIKILEDKLAFYEDLEASRTATNAKIPSQETLDVSRLFERIIPTLLSSPNLGQNQGPEEEQPSTDVAKGKRFYVNKSYGSFPATGLLKANEPFFFHTTFGAGSSITVDLEFNYLLQTIVLGNRTNGFFSRCANMFAITHIEEDCWTGAGFIFDFNHDFLNGVERFATLQLPSVRARYLTLICPLITALHLSDIQVFGHAGES